MMLGRELCAPLAHIVGEEEFFAVVPHMSSKLARLLEGCDF
jgi:hypothetical protein